MTRLFALLLTILSSASANSPAANSVLETTISELGYGWARNSVNTTVFRKNSVVSNNSYQFAAYYNDDGKVVVAKRALDSNTWETKVTSFSGNVADAHNSICIALDGNGFLHLAWDHHNSPLRYAQSRSPHSLDFTEERAMIGENEASVTYPEFHSIASGNLLFLYRDGESGRGNLVINRYQTAERKWSRTRTKVIDGENERNAYWQAYADPDSETVHLSWTWRETWDVSTNHDICYAVSRDGGQTWETATGRSYKLPITEESAEIAARIPQKSELINQTSMCADSLGRPYIVSYWTPPGTSVPQYHLVYFDGETWRSEQISQRTTPFSLSGGGTKKIPIARPQIITKTTNGRTNAYLVFRDIEYGNRPMVSFCEDLGKTDWKTYPLADLDLGQWEPSLDPAMWNREHRLALFLQRSSQGDGEGLEEVEPQAVSILYWNPEIER